MLRAVIFDLDETLINSKELIGRYYRAMFASLDVPIPDDLPDAYFFTAAETEIVERLIPGDPERQARALLFKTTIPPEEHLRQMTLKPFALETVREAALRWRLALATNRGVSTPNVLAHFGLAPFFPVVVHAKTLAHPKPHPIVVETILSALGVSPGEAALVGDSAIDAETARNGRIRSVLVGPESVRDLGDAWVPDLSGLIPLLSTW